MHRRGPRHVAIRWRCFWEPTLAVPKTWRLHSVNCRSATGAPRANHAPSTMPRPGPSVPTLSIGRPTIREHQLTTGTCRSRLAIGGSTYIGYRPHPHPPSPIFLSFLIATCIEFCFLSVHLRVSKTYMLMCLIERPVANFLSKLT